MLLLLGKLQHLIYDFLADLLIVLQRAVMLVPLSFPEIWNFNGVLLTVVHICFLCSDHGGVALLVF